MRPRPDGSAGPPLDLVRAALARLGAVRLGTRGTSMSPTVAPGTSVIVEAVGPGEVRAGDVVAVEMDGALIVHRVVAELGGGRLVTAGDNMALLDPPVDPGQVVGIVRGCAPAPPPPTGVPDTAGAAGPMRLWVCDAPDVEAPSLWQVCHFSAADARTRLVPTQARRAGAHPLRVGISEFARVPAGVLTGVGGPMDIVLGVPFGGAGHGGGHRAHLPPSVVDVHVRVDAPLTPVPVQVAVTRLAAALAGGTAG